MYDDGEKVRELEHIKHHWPGPLRCCSCTESLIKPIRLEPSSVGYCQIVLLWELCMTLSGFTKWTKHLLHCLYPGHRYLLNYYFSCRAIIRFFPGHSLFLIISYYQNDCRESHNALHTVHYAVTCHKSMLVLLISAPLNSMRLVAFFLLPRHRHSLWVLGFGQTSPFPWMSKCVQPFTGIALVC